MKFCVEADYMDTLNLYISPYNTRINKSQPKNIIDILDFSLIIFRCLPIEWYSLTWSCAALDQAYLTFDEHIYA